MQYISDSDFEKSYSIISDYNSLIEMGNKRVDLLKSLYEYDPKCISECLLKSCYSDSRIFILLEHDFYKNLPDSMFLAKILKPLIDRLDWVRDNLFDPDAPLVHQLILEELTREVTPQTILNLADKFPQYTKIIATRIPIASVIEFIEYTRDHEDLIFYMIEAAVEFDEVHQLHEYIESNYENLKDTSIIWNNIWKLLCTCMSTEFLVSLYSKFIFQDHLELLTYTILDKDPQMGMLLALDQNISEEVREVIVRILFASENVATQLSLQHISMLLRVLPDPQKVLEHYKLDYVELKHLIDIAAQDHVDIWDELIGYIDGCTTLADDEKNLLIARCKIYD